MHTSACAYAVLTSDDSILFTFGWDGKAVMWNTDTQEALKDFDNGGVKFHIACLSPDDKKAAAGDY